MPRRSIGPLALALGALIPVVPSAQVATPSMVGWWTGEAQIVVNWTRQRTLSVNIAIFAGDKVTGTVGDATLVDGRLTQNRGWLARAMHWKTDHIIVARNTGVRLAGFGQLARRLTV